MKCAYCEDTKIFFSIMPAISKDIAWASHVLVEKNGKIRLYHYQCGNVDPMGVYAQLLELMDETEGKHLI